MRGLVQPLFALCAGRSGRSNQVRVQYCTSDVITNGRPAAMVAANDGDNAMSGRENGIARTSRDTEIPAHCWTTPIPTATVL